MGTVHPPSALDTVVDSLLENHSVQYDTERIKRAMAIAVEVHANDEHWSGESMLEHIAGVMHTLAPFEPDEDAIVACLLHHVLQDGEWSLIRLEEEFGAKVRSLVSGVHLLSHVTVRDRRVSVEDLRLMLLTVSEDIRTVLITLCDRSYLLHHMSKLDEEERRRACLDAVQLFAPVAARLGIYSLKHQMEAQAFPILYPNDAERIHEQVDEVHKQHGNFVATAANKLEEHLREQGCHATVLAREKQPYSIFAKMQKKSVTHIGDIYDFYALRVVVGSVEECYQALGLLHRMARPLAHRFKDYISFPKPNGYQSLHTTLVQVDGAPEDVMVEVQVRTKDMHREAELGIAAHWSYKESGSTMFAARNAQLHQALASQEMMEEAVGSTYADHIFVLSPKGDVVELPEGATPLDFAFYVHTDLGLSFRGAKVNGAMVPIDHSLENGDVVEILKHSAPNPSPQWMQLLKLSSSRSKLRRYLYAQDRPKYIVMGKQVVNDFLKKYNQPQLDQDLTILRECDGKSLTLSQREDLLMKIGQGSEKVGSLLNRLSALEELQASLMPAPEERREGVSIRPATKQVRLEGDMRMPTRFAKCCKPDTGSSSALVGVISRKGDVVIHRKRCGMLRNANPAKQIKAWWKA